MRKYLAIGTIVLLGGGAAAWLFYFRSSGPVPPKDRTTPVILRLGGYEEGQVLEPGVPGFLRVDLRSPVAERLLTLRQEGQATKESPLPEMQVGSKKTPWWKGLRLVRKDGDRETPVAIDVIKGRNPGVRLDRGEMGYALIAVRPDVSLSEGDALLAARLTVNLDGLDEVKSAPLSVSVRRGVLTEARKSGIFSLYYRATGRLDQAVKAAEQAIQADPAKMDGYVLKAEALEQAGDYVEARRAYVAAMEHFPADSYEPPVLYQAAISRLDALIRKGAAK